MHDETGNPLTDNNDGVEVMHHEAPRQPEKSLREGYEVTDMNTTVIKYFLVGLFVLLFGAVGAIIMVMRGFEESRPPLNPEAASPLATAGIQIPDKPHLQQDPVGDRIAINAANDAQVNGYGVISGEAGMERAHIPVSLAMERVAGGKAPYRQEPVASQLPSGEQ